MIEMFFPSAQRVVATHKMDWSNTLLLSPGVRWAHNFKNGLQIVPGIAMPIGVGPSAGEKESEESKQADLLTRAFKAAKTLAGGPAGLGTNGMLDDSCI